MGLPRRQLPAPGRGRAAPAGAACPLPRRRRREPLPRVRRRVPQFRGPGGRRLRPADSEGQRLLARRRHPAGRLHGRGTAQHDVLLRPDRRQAAPRRIPGRGGTAVRNPRRPHDGARGARLHAGLRADLRRGLDQLLREDHLGVARGAVGAARRPGGREPQLAPRMAAVPAPEGLDRRRNDLPGRFPARRRFRGLPGRQPGTVRAVHPGRAHLPAVLELDAGLPAAEPAPRRLLGDPGPRSATARDGHRLGLDRAGCLPAAARRQRLRRRRRGHRQRLGRRLRH